MSKKTITLFLFIVVAFYACNNVNKTRLEKQSNTNQVYEANWESIKKHYKDLEWFNKNFFF